MINCIPHVNNGVGKRLNAMVFLRMKGPYRLDVAMFSSSPSISVRVYRIVSAMTAFCTWSRFSAWSNTMD